MTYEFGSTGNAVEWSVIADYSLTYEVTVDGSSWSSGSWNLGDGAVTISIDNLEVSSHDVAIQVMGDGGEASDSVLVVVVDTTAPEWTEALEDQTIEIWQSFYYSVNAFDLSGIDTYWVNDTVHFSIDSNGIMVNSTALEPGVYGLEIRAHDPYGNYCTAEIQVTILDSYNGLLAMLINCLQQLFPWLPYPAIVALARLILKKWLKR